MKVVTIISISLFALFASVSICLLLNKKTLLDNEVKSVLLDVYKLEHSYKRLFGSFTKNTYALAFTQDTLVTDGGKANYLISLDEATDSTFKATAVSVVDFDGDGQYSLWQVDETGNIIEIAED